MSGPNNINRSSTVDPYNNMDDWLNEDLDSALLEEGGDFSEDYESGYQNSQGRSSIALTGTAAAEQLKALYNQIKKNPDIDVKEKNKQLKELRALFDQAKSYGNKPVSNALMNAISALEVGGIENSLGDESLEGSSAEQVKKSIGELKTKINSSDLSASQKQTFLSKLDRALAALAINSGDEQISTASETFEEVNTAFQSNLNQPASVRNLADKLGKPVEEVLSAAENAGVNLDNLPHPPNNKVMNMLSELGVPEQSKVEEFSQIKSERKDKMAELKTKLASQDQEWHRETENPPSQDDFRTSFKYWSKEDDLFKQMEDRESEMRGSIVESLNALGYTASAGSKSDQIMVNGTTLDFFNEKTLTLGFSSTLTDMGQIQANDDFYPSPKNTEAETENNIWNITPDGYPKIQYTVD